MYTLLHLLRGTEKLSVCLECQNIVPNINSHTIYFIKLGKIFKIKCPSTIPLSCLSTVKNFNSIWWFRPCLRVLWRAAVYVLVPGALHWLMWIYQCKVLLMPILGLAHACSLLFYRCRGNFHFHYNTEPPHSVSLGNHCMVLLLPFL